MKKIETDELKKIQLDILCFVDDFCRKNKINYWIDCGTLLGAVRHGGYIPWDDDIDIGMLREDYDKFNSTFNNYNVHSKYQFVSIENNKEFYLAYGKVVDNNTVLIEEGHKIGVNIDVFVYDNVPEDFVKQKKMFDKRDSLMRRYGYSQDSVGTYKENSLKHLLRICRKIFYVVIQTLIPGGFVGLLVKNCKKYANIETTVVGNFSAFARMVCKKDVFNSFIELEFEGKMFKAPVGYDDWLKAFYGNYMELPPIEKRVSHHEFEAYYLEKSNCMKGKI